ncbi:MAG TPA: hypothetical protein VJA66_02440 [Thermoanaerobaculia bacterium]
MNRSTLHMAVAAEDQARLRRMMLAEALAALVLLLALIIALAL